MIKAILVDDEIPALKEMEYLLKKNNMVEIIGMYTDPLEAMVVVEKLRPDLVFLDIDMPQLNGIEVASRLKSVLPDIEVVFVTAYSEYAVKAFELQAMDYILKPIMFERLDRTVERVLERIRIQKPQKSLGTDIYISCFGQFEMGFKGKEPLKWRTEKTKELFVFLLNSKHRNITKQEIIEQLWPDVDEERAGHRLHNNIYYIRKAFEDYGITKDYIQINGNYRLTINSVNYDVDDFENCVKLNMKYLTIEEMEKAIHIYTGDFLEGHDWPWANIDRELFRKYYKNIVVKLANEYCNQKNYERAELILTKTYYLNPYEENITALLMDIYFKTGKKAMAMKHYSHYVKVLKEDLNVEPQDNIRKIMEVIKQS